MLDELRARERARTAADARAREIQAWRSKRIGEVLIGFQLNLVAGGWTEDSIYYAMSTVTAVMSSLPDFALAGSAYPPWLAASVIAGALEVPRPAPPMMPTASVDEWGMPIVSWRAIQPGD
jgi:hypothetical protein